MKTVNERIESIMDKNGCGGLGVSYFIREEFERFEKEIRKDQTRICVEAFKNVEICYTTDAVTNLRSKGIEVILSTIKD